jgi:hypothetical protein
MVVALLCRLVRGLARRSRLHVQFAGPNGLFDEPQSGRFLVSFLTLFFFLASKKAECILSLDYWNSASSDLAGNGLSATPYIGLFVLLKALGGFFTEPAISWSDIVDRVHMKTLYTLMI